VTDWQPIETRPNRPMAVLVYFANREWLNADGEPFSFGPIRDHVERMELGFWDGRDWCEANTAHDMFEPWRTPDDLPTHWMPLPEPPK